MFGKSRNEKKQCFPCLGKVEMKTGQRNFISVPYKRSKTDRRSIIRGAQLKECLRMFAYRTHFGSFLANNDVATVTALPNTIAIA